MVAIKLSAFSGEQPRVIPRLMPDSAAQSAVNARLDDGALTPMRKSAIAAASSSAVARTIYKWGANWLTWDTVVNAAPGPVADDRLYYTGDGPPKMMVGAMVYPLAVPFPAGALTATPAGAGAGDVVTRLYVYTWVTSFGEESEPCPVSNEVSWQPGNTVSLSGFTSAPTGRGITLQRIYRSQTSVSGTALYLIAERVATAANFTDDIAVDAFQEPLPSGSWNAPPNGLTGLIVLPNGMMAAFVDKKLYFCEPFRPHAWPEKYVLTTDSKIVGLGAVGTSIVVMTEAQPYMVSGAAPDTMQMEKIEQNLPCINARGVVDLGYAIAYPSNEGLIVVRPDGSCTMATANIFSKDDWQALSPTTLIGCQLSGRYVAFYANIAPDDTKIAGALFLDLTGATYLIRSNAAATSAFYDIGSGHLYFLEAGTKDIRMFDAPNASRETLYWKSKLFVLPYEENFGAILIDVSFDSSAQDTINSDAAIAATIAANNALIAAGPIRGELDGAVLNSYAFGGDNLAPIPRPAVNVTVGVYADRKRVASISKVNKAVRLPSGFKARSWEIDVFSDIQVQNIVMGKTIDDIKATV